MISIDCRERHIQRECCVYVDLSVRLNSSAVLRFLSRKFKIGGLVVGFAAVRSGKEDVWFSVWRWGLDGSNVVQNFDFFTRG